MQHEVSEPRQPRRPARRGSPLQRRWRAAVLVFPAACALAAITACGDDDSSDATNVSVTTSDSTIANASTPTNAPSTTSASETTNGSDTTNASSVVGRCEVLRAELSESVAEFVNDGLDPVPGQSPTPDELRSMLAAFAADADELAALDVGDLSDSARTAANAAADFAEFLDRTGDIRVYTDTPGDSPVDDALNGIISSIDFEGIDNAPCDVGTADISDSSSGGLTDDAIAAEIAEFARDGPIDFDHCPLFTARELAESAGFFTVTFGASEGRASSREGLGHSLFCFFSGGSANANVLVFTDTSAGVDGIAQLLDSQDIGSAVASDFEELDDIAGGTGYLSTVGSQTYGLWIAANGSWGMSQLAPSLDPAGLGATVELVRTALS
jgi:hypothetical protein